MTGHDDASSGLVRVYVWEWPVRVIHWTIVASILVSAVTGIYIGTPFLIASGPAGQRFVMGTMKVIHSYSAIAFTLAVLSRVAWMFVGNPYARWSEFLPARRQRRARIVPTVLFYLFARPKPPEVVGHNPLAGLTYSLVFLLYLVMIATGLALYSSSAAISSPMRAFEFLVPLVGGLQTARWIHHVVMWLILGFAVHHVFSAVLVSQVERDGTMESIFSGYKFMTPGDLARAADESPAPAFRKRTS